MLSWGIASTLTLRWPRGGGHTPCPSIMQGIFDTGLWEDVHVAVLCVLFLHYYQEEMAAGRCWIYMMGHVMVCLQRMEGCVWRVSDGAE